MTIRQQLEQREREILAPQAAKSADSRGRVRPEPEDPIRPAFQRDRDRVIHCKAFRRLKHKTQVFFAPTGDHYRTRLTHTLEVSQIARSIAKVLRLNEELTEAIALGHDLGHTPFGHAGERVLNDAHPWRLQPLRAEPPHRRRARERWAGAQPDVGGARRHRAPLEGQERHARRRGSRAPRQHDRGADRARRRHHRVRQSRYRRRGAGGDFGPGDAARRPRRRARPLVVRADRPHGHRRRAADDRGRHDRDPDERPPSCRRPSACAASSSRRSTRTRSRRRSSRRPPGSLAGSGSGSASSPDEFLDRRTIEAEGLDAAARDFVAGMTDRYAVSLYEQLFIPKPWVSMRDLEREGTGSRAPSGPETRRAPRLPDLAPASRP